MRRLNAKQYGKILFELTVNVKGEKEITKVAQAFVSLLARRHAIRLLPKIIAAFREYVDEQSGKFPVTITTARPLESPIRKKIAEENGAVIREEQIDDGLIGGFVMKASSVLLDASMKGQLLRLQEQLITNI